MRHYRSAQGILEHSLQDIEAGYWKSAVLMEFPLSAILKDEREEYAEYLESGNLTTEFGPVEGVTIRKNTCDIPMGCALGMVAMYGGVGTTDQMRPGYFAPGYPSEWINRGQKIPEAVVQAMFLLGAAIPESNTNRRMLRDQEGLEIVGEWDQINPGIQEEILLTVEGAITGYNDSGGTGKKKAAEWFQRAIALAKENRGNRAYELLRKGN